MTGSGLSDFSSSAASTEGRRGVILLFFLVLFRLVAFFVHIQLGIQFRKACRLFGQFFLLREGLFHLDLCRRLLLMQGGQLVLRQQ